MRMKHPDGKVRPTYFGSIILRQASSCAHDAIVKAKRLSDLPCFEARNQGGAQNLRSASFWDLFTMVCIQGESLVRDPVSCVVHRPHGGLAPANGLRLLRPMAACWCGYGACEGVASVSGIGRQGRYMGPRRRIEAVADVGTQGQKVLSIRVLDSVYVQRMRPLWVIATI